MTIIRTQKPSSMGARQGGYCNKGLIFIGRENPRRTGILTFPDPTVPDFAETLCAITERLLEN